MSRPDDLRGELGDMRYFTPELFLQLNSPVGEIVDHAMERWEKAILSYKKSLQKIRREMSPQTRPIAELSLHDWKLVGFDTARGEAGNSALIALKQDKNLVIIWYLLDQKLQRIDSPKEWSLSKKRVHWLYDELDARGHDALLHRILFSDGTRLLVPFSNCRVLHMKLEHGVSHSDLMQIA